MTFDLQGCRFFFQTVYIDNNNSADQFYMYWYNVCVAIENDKDTVKIIYSFSFECPKGHMKTSFTV